MSADEYTPELVERDREHASSPPLTFDGLRFANRRRCTDAFHAIEDWSLNDWLGAVTGELGEAASVLKEHRRGVRPEEPGPVSGLTEDQRQRLAYELADVVTYIDLLAERAGIDLGAAVREKFNIVSDRVGSRVKL